jgi:hypothetical protein
MAFIKLTHIDILNALESLKDLDDPTESETMTIKKLEMIYSLQLQKKEAQGGK